MDRVLMVVFAIATFVALAADLARGHTDKNNPSAPVEHHVRAFVNATIYLVVISLLVYYVVLPRLSGGMAFFTMVLFLVFCAVVLLATVDLPDRGRIGDFEDYIWEEKGKRGRPRIRTWRRLLAASMLALTLVCGLLWIGATVIHGVGSFFGTGGADAGASPPGSIGSSAAPTATTTTTPAPPPNCGAPELKTISPQVEVPFDPKGVERCTDNNWVVVSSTELPSKVKPTARGERDGRQYFKLDSGLVIRGPATG